MSISIDQATVLVTGANRGLGKAFAEALVERGARCTPGARDPESVTTPGATAVRLDVTDPASSPRPPRARRRHGRDQQRRHRPAASLLTGESLDGFREEIETNVFGPLTSPAPSRRSWRPTAAARSSTSSRRCPG